ncbi:hypothetical protein I4U23_002303 [Adineta vaga]|nr:hypothetical protein I4U23_002303 [Adineta vaga]
MNRSIQTIYEPLAAGPDDLCTHLPSTTLINNVQQNPHRAESSKSVQTYELNSLSGSSFYQINTSDGHSRKEPTNDGDAFEILLESMSHVANSNSGPIPSDDSQLLSIYNDLKEQQTIRDFGDG